MLLTDARRAARTGPDGRADPARRAGSHASGIATRSPRASRSSPPRSRRGSIGAYQLQAAIAAVHDEAARAEDTDWPQILALYGLLKRMSDNPMVHAQPRDRRGHGARSRGRARAAGGARRPAAVWPATTASTPCAPTCSRWPGDREAADRPLPGRGGPHHEPSGTELPHREGRAPRRRRERRRRAVEQVSSGKARSVSSARMTAEAARPTTWESLRAAAGSWRLLSVALLSFASGLPLGLVWIAIPAWMARDRASTSRSSASSPSPRPRGASSCSGRRRWTATRRRSWGASAARCS